jgi:ribosomal protein L34
MRENKWEENGNARGAEERMESQNGREIIERLR